MRIKFKDFTGAIESFFRNDASTPRVYQFPNRDITVAGTDDVATVQTDINTHEALTNNPHTVTKSQVGLSNVDNTTDAGKPVSTAGQTALDLKQNTLVSGTSIKTINTTSLLGSGDITIAGGTIDATPTDSSTNAVQSNGVFDALALKSPLASPTFTGTPAAPTASFGTNTTQLATTAFVQAAAVQGGYRVFNIVDYGAVGDSTTDDTAAIQAAIDAAIVAKGTVFIPACSGFNYYRINSGLTIIASASYPADQIYINMVGEGHINFQIVYHGSNNGSVLTMTGLKNCVFSNIKLRVASGITGVTCFDMGTNAYGGSTSQVSFRDCCATLNTGVNNKGWRIGAVSEGGNGDISNILFDNCNVWGGQAYGYSGQYGFNINGGNSLQFTWIGGGVAFCENAWRLDNGGACYFYGLGGSNNAVDFNLNFASALTIDGNRFENGKQFLLLSGNDSHSNVQIRNCVLGNYAPADGYLIQSGQNCTIIMDGFSAYKEGGSQFSANVVNLYSTSTSMGYFSWRGGYVMSSNSTILNVVDAAKWKTTVRGVGKMNTSYITTAQFADIDT
jgi:hypothetical protein